MFLITGFPQSIDAAFGGPHCIFIPSNRKIKLNFWKKFEQRAHVNFFYCERIFITIFIRHFIFQ